FAVAVTVGSALQDGCTSAVRANPSSKRASSNPRSHRKPSTKTTTVPFVGCNVRDFVAAEFGYDATRAPVRQLISSSHGRYTARSAADTASMSLFSRTVASAFQAAASICHQPLL